MQNYKPDVNAAMHVSERCA